MSSAAWCSRSISSGVTADSHVQKPWPAVPVSRCRAVIGRSHATVSSSGLPRVRSTRGSASSGSRSATGASRSMRPSSTSAIASAAVTGLVIEAPRNSASRPIGVPLESRVPRATTSTSSPRATRATRPGMSPESTNGCSVSSRSAMCRPYARPSGCGWSCDGGARWRHGCDELPGPAAGRPRPRVGRRRRREAGARVGGRRGRAQRQVPRRPRLVRRGQEGQLHRLQAARRRRRGRPVARRAARRDGGRQRDGGRPRGASTCRRRTSTASRATSRSTTPRWATTPRGSATDTTDDRGRAPTIAP